MSQKYFSSRTVNSVLSSPGNASIYCLLSIIFDRSVLQLDTQRDVRLLLICESQLFKELTSGGDNQAAARRRNSRLSCFQKKRADLDLPRRRTIQRKLPTPPLEIVVELQPEAQDWSSFTFQVHSFLSKGRAPPYWPYSREWCIIHENWFRITEGNLSIIETMEFDFIQLSRSSRADPISSKPIQCYTFHILPTPHGALAARRFTQPSLPSHILKRMISFAAADPSTKRRDIRRYGMISREWSQVIELLYLSPLSDGPVDAIPYAYALELRPERAFHIKNFDAELYRDYRKSRPKIKGLVAKEMPPPSYSDHTAGVPPKKMSIQELGRQLMQKGYSEACRAIINIVHLAVCIERVIVCPFHGSFFEDYMKELKSLRNVKSCMVKGLSGQNGMPVRRSPDVAEMLTVVSNWPCLEELHLEDCDAGAQTEDLQVNKVILLQTLEIVNTKMTGAQITFFAALGGPSPRLRRLKLSSVEGISNWDFCTFLTMTAASLEDITISSCDFRLESDNEVLALDTVMPDLPCLRRLDIHGWCVSSLAIARRPMINGRATGSFYATDCGTLEMYCLPSALESTGWKNISILRGDTEFTEEEMDIVKEASEIAKERGITLKVRRDT